MRLAERGRGRSTRGPGTARRDVPERSRRSPSSGFVLTPGSPYSPVHSVLSRSAPRSCRCSRVSSVARLGDDSCGILTASTRLPAPTTFFSTTFSDAATTGDKLALWRIHFVDDDATARHLAAHGRCSVVEGVGRCLDRMASPGLADDPSDASHGGRSSRTVAGLGDLPGSRRFMMSQFMNTTHLRAREYEQGPLPERLAIHVRDPQLSITARSRVRSQPLRASSPILAPTTRCPGSEPIGQRITQRSSSSTTSTLPLAAAATRAPGAHRLRRAG